MKIYTKTGDDGTTSLFDGTRVSKSHPRVDLYGDIDELNSIVGLAASFSSNHGFQEKLYNLQRDLFAIGSKLANPDERKQKEKADFCPDKITSLENEIDEMEKHLEPMTSFILPGGSQCSGFLHLGRTLCRRAERKLVSLSQDESIEGLYLHYLNRLSDYLFVAARFANHEENKADIPW